MKYVQVNVGRNAGLDGPALPFQRWSDFLLAVRSQILALVSSENDWQRVAIAGGDLGNEEFAILSIWGDDVTEPDEAWVQGLQQIAHTYRQNTVGLVIGESRLVPGVPIEGPLYSEYLAR